jgi:hypothetical protein
MEKKEPGDSHPVINEWRGMGGFWPGECGP